MAFIPYMSDIADVPPTAYMPCGAITVAQGTALVLNSGVLALCTGTAVPQFLALRAQTVATSGTRIPVMRIPRTMIFETTLQGAFTPVVGAKYQLHTDGACITSGTGGAAELVRAEGVTAGAKALVRLG